MFGRRFEYRDDRQLVTALLLNDEGAIQYLFHERYRRLLRFNAMKAAPYVPVDDLVQELYLHLSDDHWARLQRYDPSLPFERWLSVVSYRFFKDYAIRMIDSRRQIPITSIEDSRIISTGQTQMNTIMMDIQQGLARLEPPRDREVLTALFLHDEEPASVAQRLGITVENLYNVKRRALARLIQKHLKDYKVVK